MLMVLAYQFRYVLSYPFAAHLSCLCQVLDRLTRLRRIRVWSDDYLVHIEGSAHICKCELAVWNHFTLHYPALVLSTQDLI